MRFIIDFQGRRYSTMGASVIVYSPPAYINLRHKSHTRNVTRAYRRFLQEFLYDGTHNINVLTRWKYVHDTAKLRCKYTSIKRQHSVKFFTLVDKSHYELYCESTWYRRSATNWQVVEGLWYWHVMCTPLRPMPNFLN